MGLFSRMYDLNEFILKTLFLKFYLLIKMEYLGEIFFGESDHKMDGTKCVYIVNCLLFTMIFQLYNNNLRKRDFNLVPGKI